ncbi:MAG TPA: hypothetical protein VIM67_08150 [Terriglobus sp.]
MHNALKASCINVAFLSPLIFLSPQVNAQTAPPSLDDVLQKLEANLQRYDTNLPSLFCDESITSKVVPSSPKEDTAATSIFRLKRSRNGDGTSSLVESRDVISINGQSTKDRDPDLPVQLDGAFEGAFSVVSLSQASCFDYSMKRVDTRHPSKPYVIRFTSRPTANDSSNCLLPEKSEGFVQIDPATFEITHMEINTPRHLIRSDNEYIAPTTGKRTITIDYAPVSFGRASFWLPSVVDLKVVQGAGTFKQTTWSFHSQYRNCHQLQVTSRIVTDQEAQQH